MLFVLARGAGRAIGPAESRYRVDANLLIAEIPNCLLECVGLVHNAKILAQDLWLVKYIIARTLHAVTFRLAPNAAKNGDESSHVKYSFQNRCLEKASHCFGVPMIGLP